MRTECLAALTLLLLSTAGHAAGDPAPATDREKALNIYNWSDYIDPNVLEDFARETGIVVTYVPMDSNELLETKLLAGPTGYDVVFPSASFMGRQIKAGIYRKLDKSLLPNLQNLDPAITAKLGRFDPDNQHAAIYAWGTSGIAYNESAVQKYMPDAPVDSFAMLYDPEIVSRFAECGVSVLDAPSEVIATVLIYLGKDSNSEKPEDLAAAEAVLKSIRPYLRLINSSTYIEQLASGEICLSLGWSGDVLQAQGRSEEAGKPFRIEYRVPREGAVMFFDSMAIPADAMHVKNAHLFINFMLRSEVAAANSRFTGFPNGNLSAQPRFPIDVMADKNFFPSPDMQKRLVPDLPESSEYIRKLTGAWTRFRTGKYPSTGTDLVK